MKKVLALMLFCLCFVGNSIAQENTNNVSFDKIAKKLSPSSTLKDVKKNIKEAENLYKYKLKTAQKNQEENAKLMFNFAFYRREVFDILLQEKLVVGKSNKAKVSKYETHHENAKEAIKLLEDSIQIYEQILEKRTLYLAAAKFELARISEDYTPRSRYASKWKDKIEQIKKTQELYIDSLAIRKKLLGDNDDTVLISKYYLANSYCRNARFEEALPLYESYISTIEAKHGKHFNALLPAYKVFVGILEMMGEKSLSNDAKIRVSELSKDSKDLEDWILDISARAKSFEYKGINAKEGRVDLYTSSSTISQVNGLASSDISVISPSLGASLSRTRVNAVKLATITATSDFPDIVPAIVTANEDGDVIDVEALTENSKLKAKIEQNIKEWKFEPFIYDGKARKIRGLVYYYD